MSPITHFLVGWTVANSVPSLTKRERAWVTWAGVLPDLDGLGIIAEWATRNSTHPLRWWSEYHHVVGHNLGFGLLLAGITLVLARNKLTATALVLISFHLHLLGDLIGARGPDGEQWPIPYLSPFSRAWAWRWQGQWALNAWPNFLITAMLIVTALALACRRGFSPVEIFSSKADAIVIKTLRARFGSKMARTFQTASLD